MNEETIAQIQSIIFELAQQLGTTGEYLWAILVKQQYVDGIINFCVLPFLLGIMYMIYVHTKKVIAERKKEGDFERYGKKTEAEIWTVSLILQVIVLLFVVIFFLCGLSSLLNPEYYALRSIFDML